MGTFDELLPDDPLVRRTPGDPLSCTERVAIPAVADAYDAQWSPDSSAIVTTRIVTVPNARMITGTEEEQRVTVVELATGATRELGRGTKPQWSGFGTYVSFWREGDEDLRVVKGDRLAAWIPATQPDVRWVGDDLYFWHDDEIRVWSAGLVMTVSRVAEDLAPRYPRDDTAFSADGTRFTITRYSQSGGAERYFGVTATGEAVGLPDDGTTFTQWAPVGHTLLLRSPSTIALNDGDRKRDAPLTTFTGRVHGWTADGRLLVGAMSPTVPGGNAFDRFHAWTPDGSDVVATLPNLLGMRSFSPDGRAFLGVSRTGLYSTRLEVYRCGTSDADTSSRADTTARKARIEDDGRRFVRPVAGAITQYVQGNHTGIDIGAPHGSILVAADDGVVDAAGWVPVGGLRVCVQHAGGLESCDYHTALPLVSIGDAVTRGQPVALVGMTGLTSGPHVHWEAKQDGRIVDPLGR